MSIKTLRPFVLALDLFRYHMNDVVKTKFTS